MKDLGKNGVKMLRIAVDGNEANVVNRVGSNVYAFELLRALEELTRSKNQEVLVTVLLSTPPHEEWPMEREGWQYVVVKPAKFWTQWAEPLYLSQNKKRFDVFYTPGHYAPRFCSLPCLTSVMDLAFLEFPDHFKKKDWLQLAKWTEYSARQADKVAVISEFTKSEVMRHYGKSETDLALIPPGGGEIEPEAVSRVEAEIMMMKAGIGSHFFLYVGTIQPRKNLIRLVAAFDLLCSELGNNGRSLQLVLAGKIGWLADETLARIETSPYKKQIVMPGFVSDEFKQVLLGKCLGNFNLGLYEGFGIPALEALQFGSIPVVANNTSLPEVVGEAGIKVDPYDIKKIKMAMKRLLSVTIFERDVFLAQARKQVKKYTYESSARLLLQALEKMADHESKPT